MASRTRRVGVARSRLRGKADRNRHRYAVAMPSGIGHPERAVPLIRRSPGKSRNESSSLICIPYLTFQSRIFLPVLTLPETPGESSSTRQLLFGAEESTLTRSRQTGKCSREPQTAFWETGCRTQRKTGPAELPGVH
jgi:hypothetical protein